MEQPDSTCASHDENVSKFKQDKQKAIAHIFQGHAKFGEGKFQLAIEQYGKAWEISKQLGDEELEINALRLLGGAYIKNNQAQKAMEYLFGSCEIAKEHGYKDKETMALVMLGDACISNSQYLTAIKYFKEALEIAKEQEDRNKEVAALRRLGNAYKLSNQVKKAIEYFEKAVSIAKKQADRNQEARALFELGETYSLKEQFQKAIKYFEEALNIAKELEDKSLEMKILFSLTIAYESMLQFPKALQYSHEALRTAEEMGDKDNEIVTITRKLIERNSLIVDLDPENDTHQALPNSSDLAQLQDNEDEDSNQGESSENADVSKKQMPDAALPQTLLQSQDDEKSFEVPNVKKRKRERPKSWKWERRSIVHREKFNKLLEYGRDYPKDIMEINNVRVCFMNEFLIGSGIDTRVHIGLGKDGYERAVKRLAKDNCALLAEHEKRMLNEQNAIESNNVVKYWFLDDECDNDWMYLIMDLCEENLEEFVKRSSLADCSDAARDVILQVFKGLADLHRDPNCILHRDLKPHNILRNVHGKWLLADFGLSRVLPQEASTIRSNEKGTRDWKAVESCSHNRRSDAVRYKKKSDIQVAGMVAFYIVTKGEHPFGEEPDRLRNLLGGKPVGLDNLQDPAAKDLISWTLSHDPKDRPSAEEALKHPYLQSPEERFEMLCKMGNEAEIMTRDVRSDVVKELNSDLNDWRNLIAPDVLTYFSSDSLNGMTIRYNSSWTDCLRLIQNVKQHWHHRPRPRSEVFYDVNDPQEYFLNLFPNLPVEVHRIVRSCDWRERPDLKKYFIATNTRTRARTGDIKTRTEQKQEKQRLTTTPTPQSPISSQPLQLTSPPVRKNIPLQPLKSLRTRIGHGSQEYQNMEKLLHSSAGQNALVINQIDKIVSDALWEKYKSKKKSMVVELPVGDVLNDLKLFIPCLHDDIERIMKGNVSESRIILHDQPFGPGYYFTSNVSSCIQWCKEHYPRSRISLIVCQVLLGTYTQGSRGLKEFPRRPDGRFYDSLVDNKDDPAVFVIENVDQCYPAFIIDLSYTFSPTNDAEAILPESPELWKWEESSKVHRIKFVSLLKYGKIHPKDIQVVNGVRFCRSEEFLVGMGSDGTRVYVGLAEDGYERAVKCIPKDACAGLAEQEKIVLNKSNAKKSNHVVRYWLLDDKSDRHYLFLVLDLCEESLETFIAHSDLKDLVTIAPDIIQQILKGLVDLHREPQSILHRDLKPYNILRNVDGDWLLADFGISRMLRKGASTHLSNQKGTEDWRAVESSCTSTGIIDNGTVRYKKKSDIQVAGIVAFYIVTKGGHPFGEKPDRLRNLLDGKPVGLDALKDPAAKDLIFWMLSHDPTDRPSAEEALKHPYLQSKKQQFEMLCKVGNQQEIKKGDSNSPVVQNLNNDPTSWQTQMRPDVLNYLCTDFTNKKPKGFCYKPSWTDCLRLIRNVNQHWHDQPRPLPQPEAFYVVGDPQEYFLTRFPNLPVVVHGIVRSRDWRERPDLKEYFM